MKRYTAEEFVRTYLSWQSMMQRCVYGSKNGKREKRLDFYIYRNTEVDPRWHKFVAFIEDLGPRPGPEYSLDRIDGKGGYNKGNCQWANHRQQAENRKSTVFLTFNGVTRSQASWARATGLSKGTIGFRLKQGWSVEKTLTTPAQAENPAYKSFSQGRESGKKLSKADVEEIVSLARSGTRTATSIGKQFDVGASAICHITKQFGIAFKKGRPKK